MIETYVDFSSHYGYSQIQFVVDTFGEDNTMDILEMCTAYGIDVMKLTPKKQ